ncbi:MAG: hypothetical protein ISS25_04040 [Nanoarchaeota archaeon]|nr:hypothetical protein [DPANN group archaeon]MBL7116972.1 hypothetical protein [Nanoarchaeota archaeon]
MEFVILMTFMMLIFTVTFVVIQQKTIDIKNTQTDRQVNALGNVIKNEVDMANSVHEGYKKNFWLPDYINGVEYSIQLLDNVEVVIKYKDKDYYVFLITNLTGQIDKGYNTIKKNSSGIFVEPGQI